MLSIPQPIVLLPSCMHLTHKSTKRSDLQKHGYALDSCEQLCQCWPDLESQVSAGDMYVDWYIPVCIVYTWRPHYLLGETCQKEKSLTTAATKHGILARSYFSSRPYLIAIFIYFLPCQLILPVYLSTPQQTSSTWELPPAHHGLSQLSQS